MSNLEGRTQRVYIVDFCKPLFGLFVEQNEKKILLKGVLMYILTYLRLNYIDNLNINETCEF